jgi:hypothetical protein
MAREQNRAQQRRVKVSEGRSRYRAVFSGSYSGARRLSSRISGAQITHADAQAGAVSPTRQPAFFPSFLISYGYVSRFTFRSDRMA